jgi:hypothetical protein
MTCHPIIYDEDVDGCSFVTGGNVVYTVAIVDHLRRPSEPVEVPQKRRRHRNRCKVLGCTRKHKALGRCGVHYNRWVARGRP